MPEAHNVIAYLNTDEQSWHVILDNIQRALPTVRFLSELRFVGAILLRLESKQDRDTLSGVKGIAWIADEMTLITKPTER